MKFNSLVLITIFLGNFAYAIELIQFKLFFAKTLAVNALEKTNITLEKLLSMSLKTNNSEGFIGAP